MKFCSSCHLDYSDDCQFCEECGSKLVVKEEVVTPQNQTKNCVACGGSNAMDSQFCEHCGTSLKNNDAIVSSSPEVEKTESFINTLEDIPTASQLNEPGDSLHSTTTHQSTPDSNERMIGIPVTEVLSSSRTETNVKPSKNKPSKRTIIVGSSVAVLLAIGGGGYKFAESYYSKERQVKRYQEILLTHDPKKLAASLTSTDSHFKVSKDSVTNLTDYMSENKAYASQLTDELSTNKAKESDLFLKKNGKDFLFFDHYDLMIQPVYFELTTNIDDMTLTMNEQDQGKANKAHSWKIGPVSPGLYSFKGAFKFNDETSDIEQVVEVVNREGLQKNNIMDIDFNVNKVKFDVKAEHIKEATILLNEKEIGQLKDGVAKGIELIWHEEATIQFKQKIGGLEIVSEPIEFFPEDYMTEDYQSNYSTLYVPEMDVYVSSNAPVADLYINNKKVVKLDDEGNKQLYLVQTDTELKANVKRMIGKTEEVSDTETIDGPYDSLSFNFEEDISESDVSAFLSDFYSEVSDGTNDSYTFNGVSFEHYFVGGNDNAVYNDFDSFMSSRRKSKTISRVDSQLVEVENMQRVDTDSYQVQYVMNYHTYYSDGKDSVDEYFRYKKALLQVDSEGELQIKNLGAENDFEKVND